ncbi:hypothetical protein HYW21_02710 [Candidatus Woesearchaeota archaeon]|nr:hypothetical protein [Candidatus Woesearchaeota archaeon]
MNLGKNGQHQGYCFFLSFLLSIAFLLLYLPLVSANTYVTDLNVILSKTVYTLNESLELKGTVYLSNFSTNGSVVQNHTEVANASINISVINKASGVVISSTGLTGSATGTFYSQSSYFSNATRITAPSTSGNYYLRANYTDLAGTDWWTQIEFEVANQSVDKLIASTDKSAYNPSQTMQLFVEAIAEINDEITFIQNVSINGSIRNSAKSVLSSFSCNTSTTGKCTVTTTAPSSYGTYIVEVNNFKGFSSFTVKPFDAILSVKDELAQSIKGTFTTDERASFEVTVLTNATNETYRFNGTVTDKTGNIAKNISTTLLNSTNGYVNRFTTTLDAINFQPGTYFVTINITNQDGTMIQRTTSFQLQTWDLSLQKSDLDSGFAYEYSVFANATIAFQLFPTWRANASIINSINTTTSMTLLLKDGLDNAISSANATWNASCGKEGCYTFSLISPSSAGKYVILVAVSFNNHENIVTKPIRVITTMLSSLSTNGEGSLKELFGTQEPVYITFTAQNSTGTVLLSDARVVSVTYGNGTELSYLQVNAFDSVNLSNNDSEWAWNATTQKLKLDPPSEGGLYTVYISADNGTSATAASFIINPYDVCLVPKNTPGQAGGSTGYYYVWHFKTTDTIYFEMKVAEANNPTGRASFSNATNSSYGMGQACTLNTQTQQAVTNATITIVEVVQRDTGKVFVLNASQSSCQADNSQGSYTCTIKALQDWDGGSYSVTFLITGQNGQTQDVAYGGFEARAFYLYGYALNWRNKPTNNISLNVYMYEAGNNWWGNYGSGGLSGTLTVKKVRYQGSPGQWIWPPIEYAYNVSQLNTSTVTNGQGNITLPVTFAPGGEWKPGSYSVTLQGTDSGGTSDYGDAWFEIRQWEVYASPVECSSGSCTSVYNINSRNNISLYVTIQNAGEWGQSGNSLGGNVSVRVKKLQDCRKWPCADLNESSYTATNITVSTSNGWYWSGSINTAYLINLTPTSGTWGTGYYQVVLDVNDSETGSGWFNTIAFYAEAQPTDATGSNWKYSIKNNEPMYFKVTTARSQKSGSYYSSYTSSDYLNTTIVDAVLRRWDSQTYQQVEYTYPEQFNITIVGGGTTINGTKIINLSYTGGTWPSGYMNGELTLRDNESQTATAWLWFDVKPFRVEVTTPSYSIDASACVNGTISIREPDWSNNALLSGTYRIISVIESSWQGSYSSVTNYTNITPSGTFGGNSSFSVCPNNGAWGSGSWGNYHYLTIQVADAQNNIQEGWLSFRAVPFQISWGTPIGGTNIPKSNNITVSVSVQTSSGSAATGNLTSIYQWRYDSYISTLEYYNFSVGNCSTRNAGVTRCQITGTQNLTIYPPSGSWRKGYNYLTTLWSSSTDATSTIENYGGVWFNANDVYTGWGSGVDINGNWKYNFGLDENLSLRLYVRDVSNNPVTVNVTKVEYSTPSESCWSDSCRAYSTATFDRVGSSTTNLSDNAIIRIVKPSATNWTRGYIYVRATVNGSSGYAVIDAGSVYVKDLAGPTINVTSPATGTTFTGLTGAITTTFPINWTTTEDATCYIYVVNYDNFYSWYCPVSYTWYNISSTVYCNNTVYRGSTYIYDYAGSYYRSWSDGSSYGWTSAATGLTTGGRNHSFAYGNAILLPQDYGVQIYCSDIDWNYAYGWSVFRYSSRANVTLGSPSNNVIINMTNPTLNYTLAGPASANCSLYSNKTGTWAINTTSSSVTRGQRSFTTLWRNGTFLWNVYCIDTTNTTNTDWGDQNWTFTNNYTG